LLSKRSGSLVDSKDILFLLNRGKQAIIDDMDISDDLIAILEDYLDCQEVLEAWDTFMRADRGLKAKRWQRGQ